jgi:hypothetical protein
VEVPDLLQIASGQQVSCHFAEDAQTDYTTSVPR